MYTVAAADLLAKVGRQLFSGSPSIETPIGTTARTRPDQTRISSHAQVSPWVLHRKLDRAHVMRVAKGAQRSRTGQRVGAARAPPACGTALNSRPVDSSAGALNVRNTNVMGRAQCG